MATARIIVMEERAGYQAQTRPPDKQDKTEKPALPFSCSTNLSNDVLEGLRFARLRADAYAVCLYMHRLTFGNAGLQRRQRKRDPGLWCDFKLSDWAKAIPCDKGNLSRIMRHLETCNIVLWQNDDRTTGRLGWNADLSAWSRYGAPGGTRTGAGAPKGNQNARKTIKTTTGDMPENNQYDNTQSINTTTESINTTTKTIKTTTTTGLKPASEAARDDAEEYINNSPNGENEETVTNVTARSAKRADVTDAQNNQNNNTETTAFQASAESSTPSSAPPPSPAPRRPRKLNDEQLAKHRDEQAYCAEMLKAEMAAAKVKMLPHEGREKRGAHWFYHAGSDGASAEIAHVMAFYRFMKQDAFWHGRFLSLENLQGPWAQHDGNIDVFRAAVAEERKARGHSARAAPPTAAPLHSYPQASSPWAD